MRERLIEEEEEKKVDKATKKLGASALLSSNDLWEAEVSLSLRGDWAYMLQSSSL